MKFSMLMLVFFCFSAFATIPAGKYKVEKIQCHKSKEVMKLGGKYMSYDIFLNITDTKLQMNVSAKSRSHAPFNLKCDQTNAGSIVYTKENIFEGELKITNLKCNAWAYEKILKMKNFGVEDYGEFTYSVNGNKLTVYKPNTKTNYRCKSSGDYPIYHYIKM